MTQLNNAWGSLNADGSGTRKGLIHITNSESIGTAPYQYFLSTTQTKQSWGRFIVWFLLSIGIHALCFGLGLSLIGTMYMDITPGYTNNTALNILTPTAVTGVGLWLIGNVIAPLSIGFTLLSLRSAMIMNGGYVTHNTVINYIGTGISTLIFFGICSFIGYSWTELIQANETFNVNYPDSLKQFLGGCVFATYIPLGFMSLLITYKFWFPSSDLLARLGITDDDASVNDHQKLSLRVVAPGLFGLTLIFTGVIGSTCILCCVWNFHAAGYFYSQSPYSILFDPNAQWVLGPVPTNPNYIQPYMYIKLYQDVLVYFAVVIGIVITGFTALRVPLLRRILHTRIGAYLGRIARDSVVEHGKHVGKEKIFSISHYVHEIIAYIAELCVGEVMIVSAITALACYWFWFWSTGYNRITNEVLSYNDNYPNLHIYARVLGHMTTFFMSFLTFPVTRNSVWESAFGIPFDRAIKHHRVLGRLCWLTVTVHMLMWQIKWLMEGKLLQNIVNVEKLEVTPCTNMPDTTSCAPDNFCCGNSAHFDNFTIPIAEFAWLLLTVSLILATFARRWNYELFQYTHHVALFFYLAALIHAWTNWYYTAVGLILYVFDKITRTVKANRTVEVVSLSHAAGITRLIIRSSALGSKGHHYAGQYCFINIPTIDQFQWHPFTVSSSPCTGTDGSTISFHIKDMGPKTWTHSLAELALSIQETQRITTMVDSDTNETTQDLLRTLPVSIDGAYGNMGHYYEKDTLIMFAGGIGITPFHSVLQDLHQRALDRPETLGNIRKIHLVWVVRDLATSYVFGDSIMKILAANPGKLFSIAVYCTYGPRNTKEPRSPTAIDDNDENETAARLLTDGGRTRLLNETDKDQSNIPTPQDVHWVTPENAAAMAGIIQYGRPNLDGIMRNITSELYRQHHQSDERKSTQKDTNNVTQPDLSAYVTTMVCGPHTMHADISALAFKYRTDFHGEIFHF